MPPPGLAIRALGVRYPGAGREALRDVTFAVAPGTLTSVAGRNRAGKSTLCLAAAGLLPRVVRAEVRGSVAGAGPAGLVLADPAAGLTGARANVREEVAFGLENLGLPRDRMDDRIDEALDALGIAHLGERDPATLSGGEQQRVAIAGAVAMGAPLLVLDEAAAELDPVAAEALASLLPRLAGRGTTVLAADHAEAVLRIAGRTVVLDDGQVVALDVPATALAHPSLQGGPSPAAAWQPASNEPAPGVAVQQLTYRYAGGVEALRDVTLEIESGQAVAIVGANGSGKSTLAKHLVGLLRPTSGSVRIDGRDVGASTVEALARAIGFVFQDPRDQLFGRTVRDAVAFGPRNLRLPATMADAITDAALEAVGLADRRAVNPHDLDLAARKQLAIAGALAMDPGLVILDEPTTGQDRPGLARVEAVIHALRAARRTVVAITHDLDLAGRAFDRIIRLDDGRIVADRSVS
jgi:energy-coupling factor transport system ATP-binding protein